VSLFDSARWLMRIRRTKTSSCRPHAAAYADELAGQEHVLGPGKPYADRIDAMNSSSVILWGPPGWAKTASPV